MLSRQIIDSTSESIDSGIQIREASRDDLERPELVDNYFSSCLEGIGRDLEISSFRNVANEYQKSEGWVGLYAEGGEGFGVLLAQPKPWDSDMVGVPTKNVFLVVRGDNAEYRVRLGLSLVRKLLCNDFRTGYFVTRVASDDVSLLQALEEIGFRTVVPMVTLGRDYLCQERIELPDGVEISSVRAEEVGAVSSISADSFQWGRFSADLRIPKETASTVHETWARNCALGTHAAHTFVARNGASVLGFISVKYLSVNHFRVGSIELVATLAEARGLGIGRALIRSGCNWLMKSTPHIVVRTELPNTRALRMYEKEDFRILSGSMYLTLWRSAFCTNTDLHPL